MGDKQSCARKAKKNRIDAQLTFENAVVVRDVTDGHICSYKTDEMEIANDKIVSALAETKFVYEQLEKDSYKKKEYEREISNLQKCKTKIDRVKGLDKEKSNE